MKIRTGKVIKAKNIFGSQVNISLAEYSNGDQLSFYNSFYAYNRSYHENLFSGINLTQNHKYYFYVNGSGFSNNVLKGYTYVYEGNTLYLDQYQSSWMLSDTEADSIWQFTQKNITNLTKFYIGKLDGSTPIVNYFFLVDLTEIFGSGKEPTRQQFYNKYKKYFPFIATGEEITIDSCNGKVNLRSPLPLEYQQVESITSDNKAFIDTRVVIGTSFALEIDYALNNPTTDAKFFGSYDDNGWAIGILNSKYRNLLNWQTINYTPTSNRVLLTTQNNGAKITITENGTSTQLDYTAAKANSYDYTAYLFAAHFRTDIVGGKCAMTLYSCKIYTNNTLVRDYIPCYRKSDNEVGLYDLVSHQFFGNAYTEGSFTKGNNVNTILPCKVAGGSSDIYYGYNQLCSDTFDTETGWGTNYGTLSASNGVATFTLTQDAQYVTGFGIMNTVPTILNHVYLLFATVKHTTANLSFKFRQDDNYSSSFQSTTDYQTVSWIHTATGKAWHKYQLIFDAGSSGEVINVKNCMCIDLTDWFGAGKEPTTVAEFKEKFNKDYYSYVPSTIKLTEFQINALPLYGYNQLVQNGDFSSGKTSWNNNGGVTATVLNSILSFTATAQYGGIKQVITRIFTGHKYLITYLVNQASESDVRLRLQNVSPVELGPVNSGIWEQVSWIGEGTVNATGNTDMYIRDYTSSDWEENQIKNVMIIDLTEWYGAGNEPTTVEEFKQTFYKKYYPYVKKSMLNKYMINAIGE